MPEETVGPLDRLRVLDLTRLLPGGYCTLVLADMGAEVIKVEDPRGGDPLRAVPPQIGGTSVYFHALNRNKRSVTLDLRQQGATAVLDRLVDTADVLIESFRPLAARRLGVSASDLLARHPRLVHCSLTGFGQNGPYAERAAHDLNFMALSGLFEVDSCGDDRAERPQGRQVRGVPKLLVTDVGGAWAAATAIAAALFKRERTGHGSAIDISIHDVAVSWLTFPAAAQFIAGAPDPRFAITDGQACYNIYTTADGREVALAAIEQKFWETFLERAGRPDLVPLQFLPSAQDRLRQEIAGIIGARTLDEWLRVFGDVDVCLTPINNIADVVADPHVAARATIGHRGNARYIRSPIVFSAPGGAGLISPRDSRPPVTDVPALGADTDDVLGAAGIDEQMRQALRSKAVI